MAARGYERSVFINCPFDTDYKDLFDALVFAVYDCGFVARSAREADDSAEVRIEKILGIVEGCRFGIHDISRTELNAEGLPRFNMPLELGLFLGARRFGDARQRRKVALVLDRAPYRFQRFCSDIAGQDPHAHQGDVATAISIVRDWLRNATKGSKTIIPGGVRIAERYVLFRGDLPAMCAREHLDPTALIYNDFTALVVEWLRANAW